MKQNYQFYLKRKNTNLVRQSKIMIKNNYLTTKNFEKSDTADTK